MAACIATLDLYKRDKLFERAAEMSPKFESAVHGLRGAPYVKDVHNLGMVAGVELESRPGAPGPRLRGIPEMPGAGSAGTRYTGDILAFSPPLIISEAEIDQMFIPSTEALQQVK
jgi:beta-alanine--pyruvate transaminase